VLTATILLAGGVGSGFAQEKTVAARGQFHYQRYCAVCHGDQGKGSGPVAEYLKTTPADLTQTSKKNGGTFPFWRVYRVIDGSEVIVGHGTREMPIWGQELRIEERKSPAHIQEDVIAGRIWQITVYLESIQEK
jgi:mono/diheme cytochrome c family protein